MEEILSSIRKIINDDDETEADPAASAPDDNVLELTERVEDEPGVAEAAVEEEIDAILASGDDDKGTGSVVVGDEGLVSGKTKSGVTSAMSQFAGALAKEKSESGVPGVSGPTLDALVLAVLEPQLKNWLDENLEPLVERLVKEELKRMARRAEDI